MNGKGWRPLVLILAFVLTALLLWFLAVLEGDKQRVRIGFMHLVFSGIVQRGIFMANTQVGHAPEGFDGNPSYFAALENIKELNLELSNKDVHCDLPIDIRDTDPLVYPGVVSIVLRSSPMKVAVIFYGSIPDVGPFFDIKLAYDLLRATATQVDQTNAVSQDLRAQYAHLFDEMPSGSMLWISKVCQNFSFIQFEEMI